MKIVLQAALFSLILTLNVNGASTEIGDLESRVETVLTLGSQTIGGYTNSEGTALLVSIKEVNGNTAHKYAMLIQILAPKTNQTFTIDFLKIGGLTNALHQLLTLQPSAVKLGNYQGMYKTDQGLVFKVWYEDTMVYMSVSDGSFTMRIDNPFLVRDLFGTARGRLTEIGAGPPSRRQRH